MFGLPFVLQDASEMEASKTYVFNKKLDISGVTFGDGIIAGVRSSFDSLECKNEMCSCKLTNSIQLCICQCCFNNFYFRTHIAIARIGGKTGCWNVSSKSKFPLEKSLRSRLAQLNVGTLLFSSS
jgi:hypothetical protein